MVLLPRLLFVFLTVNLDILESILNRMQSIFNNFIWNNKKPQLRMSVVHKKLLVPNIGKYYHASILEACVDCRDGDGSEMSLRELSPEIGSGLSLPSLD